MTPETPLTEVAKFLPTLAAKVLLEQDQATQKLVCTFLRDAICFWEKEGLLLDPVQLEIVSMSLVGQMIAVAGHIDGLNKEIDAHKALLAMAQDLLQKRTA